MRKDKKLIGDFRNVFKFHAYSVNKKVVLDCKACLKFV